MIKYLLCAWLNQGLYYTRLCIHFSACSCFIPFYVHHPLHAEPLPDIPYIVSNFSFFFVVPRWPRLLRSQFLPACGASTYRRVFHEFSMWSGCAVECFPCEQLVEERVLHACDEIWRLSSEFIIFTAIHTLHESKNQHTAAHITLRNLWCIRMC